MNGYNQLFVKIWGDIDKYSKSVRTNRQVSFVKQFLPRSSRVAHITLRHLPRFTTCYFEPIKCKLEYQQTSVSFYILLSDREPA